MQNTTEYFLYEVSFLTAIPLIGISIVGVFVSFVHSLFQIQDQTTQYLSKIGALILIWIYFGPFYESRFTLLFTKIIGAIAATQ